MPVKMITPNTNLSPGSVDATFLGTDAVEEAKIKDQAVSLSKIRKPGSLAEDKVLTYNYVTNLVEWQPKSSVFDNYDAIAAVEGESTLELSEGVTVDGDILFGDYNALGLSYLPARGIQIVNDSSDVKWSAISLEEYGGDFADADDKPFNITNPGVYGVANGGSVASPTAMPENKRTLTLAGNARYGTGAGEIDTVAQIEFTTAEAQTSTNRGGKMVFKTNSKSGGTTLRDNFLFDCTETQVNFAFCPTIVGGSNPHQFERVTFSSQGSDTYPIVFDENTKFADDVQIVGDLDMQGATTFGDVVTLDSQTSDPSSPSAGDMYFNSTNNNFRGYNGTEWVDLDTSGLETNVDIAGTLDVTGVTTLDDDLNVDGEAEFNSPIVFPRYTTFASLPTTGVSQFAMALYDPAGASRPHIIIFEGSNWYYMTVNNAPQVTS